MNVFHHFRSKLGNLIVSFHFYFSTLRNEYVNAILVAEGSHVPLHVKNFPTHVIFAVFIQLLLHVQI
jgi:hypothetical protein